MQPLNEAAKHIIVHLEHQRHLHREELSPDQRQAPVVVEAVGKAPVSCPQCKGAGYLRANVPFGHPLWGRAIECECTKARKREAHRRRLWEQSKIDQLVGFQEASFETFQFWHPGVHVAYEAASQFASLRPDWLVLQGTNGCGKTHLAVAIARRMANKPTSSREAPAKFVARAGRRTG